jgi:hypothetical protein
MTTAASAPTALSLFDLADIPAVTDAGIVTERFLGTCRCCGKTARVEMAADPSVKRTTTRCAAGHTVIVTRVVAHHTGHRCNPDCMTARGPICRCGCGGANHGAGWSL